MTMTADTPQGRRRERVAERLRAALAAIEADPSASATPAALARMAGVGRNTLYANHRPILDALRALQASRRPRPTAPGRLDDTEARAELESKLRALATQNAGLLQRALVAEQRAARLEERNAELARTLDAIRKPAPITAPQAIDRQD